MATAAGPWLDNRVLLRIAHHVLCACYAAADVTVGITMYIELLFAIMFHLPWMVPTLFIMLYILGSASLQAYCVRGNAGIWVWLEAVGPVRSPHAHAALTRQI